MRRRQLIWTTAEPDRRALARQGFHVVKYPRLKRRVLASRCAGASRSSLGNPAAGILSLFRRQAKVALLGVTFNDLTDLQALYGYVVEPAHRWGCTLLIAAPVSLDDLPDLISAADMCDQDWRYPWTWERLQHIAALSQEPVEVNVPVVVNRWRQLVRRWFRRGDVSAPVGATTRLDAQQWAAVQAGDGVVQIIAPAGSGKTTVLIERVKQLQRRGTAAERILCLSFNREAKVEVAQRLAAAGVAGAVVRSFHGMGLAILKAEGGLRSGIDALSDRQVATMVAAAVARETDSQSAAEKPIRISVAEAREVICNFKLAAMIEVPEAVRQATAGDVRARISARIYQLYEQELARQDVLDFDDLVANAVRLLQREADVRRRWQARFARVLVDEYQDIEPSQALLVGILAAPEDSLFCVGDEDQCIYAWRRATVQRIIELDQVYPGLERHALIRNYRCGRKITVASRHLIEHNQTRFRKPLRAGARQAGEIVVGVCEDRTAGAELVAHLISDAVPGEVVVLARTARLLAEVSAAQRRMGTTEGVELATIHSAKGREWQRVILFGADEGQAPHAHALVEGGLEDERRLFYVAITRAIERLEIICSDGRESRFLREARVWSGGL